MKISMDSDVSVELTEKGLTAYKNTIERMKKPSGNAIVDVYFKKCVEDGYAGILNGNILSCKLWQLFRLFDDQIDCNYKLFFEEIQYDATDLKDKNTEEPKICGDCDNWEEIGGGYHGICYINHKDTNIAHTCKKYTPKAIKND